jgi:CheY-like chemotaxis protein
MLDVSRDLDRVTRAQQVRRVLLDCIEALRPQRQGDALSEAARAYAILTYRYVDGLSMEEIEEKLALSRRQVYREHAKGVEAVASVLWDRMNERGTGSHVTPSIAGDTAGDRLKIAQAEVVRLQGSVHIEPLSLQEVLERVLGLLAPRIRQTGIQVKVAPGTWPAIVADRVMLRQAFLNLLSYALDTVTQGDLVITASWEQRGLLVEIGESSGVPGAQPARVPASKRAGVGMAVAQALIEAQGGHLETCQHDGRWQARILLPGSARTTVLVVDDNANLIALFQRYLGGHDVCVVGATDGEQALRLATELQPQAITLDVMMPSQDGWEILQRLKSSPDTKHIPIIICSVLNEPQIALAMGASDYLTKPVNQLELLEVLRRWLGVLQPAG